MFHYLCFANILKNPSKIRKQKKNIFLKPCFFVFAFEILVELMFKNQKLKRYECLNISVRYESWIDTKKFFNTLTFL